MRRSCAPERISVGTFGSTPGWALPARGVRPARAGGDQAVAERRGGVERVEVGARQRLQRAGGFREPCRCRRGALPGEGHLFAGRRHVQRFVDLLRFFGGVTARHAWDQTLRQRLQAQQRIGIVVQSRAHRGRQQRAQGRVQVAGLEDPEQSGLAERGVVAVARAVVHGAAEGALAQSRRQGRDVGHGVGGDPRAGVVRAQLAEHRGDRLEGGDRERFRPVRRHDRVEHERFDVLRVAFGVLLGHLRAVGGAVQHELFVARRPDGSPRCLRPIPASCSRRAPGPISSAQRSNAWLALLLAPKLLSAPQLSGSEAPVPRWSKTSRSRVVSAGASALAMNSPSGSAACPGPPASATTAVLLWVGPACLRSTLNESAPAARPVRLSGTGTVVHVNPAADAPAQGTKLSAAPAEATPHSAEQHNASTTTSRSVGARRRHRADVSGRRGRGAPFARRPLAGRCPGDARACRPAPRRASSAGRSRSVPCAAARSADVQDARARAEAAGDRHARDVGVPVERQRLAGQPRPAGAQTAAAQRQRGGARTPA